MIKSIAIKVIILFFGLLILTECRKNIVNDDTNPGIVIITSITLDTNEITLTVGETYYLGITIQPPDYDEKYYLSTSSTKIATIDGNGMITAVSPGIADIKVSTEDERVVATCVVTVISPNYSIGESINIDGFISIVEEVFYARASSGKKAIDVETGAYIIVAKIKFENNTSSSVWVTPLDFYLINGTIQCDYADYSGTLYDYNVELFPDNESKDIMPGVIYTMYVVFKSNNNLTEDIYYIVNDDYKYGFKVQFSVDDIK